MGWGSWRVKGTSLGNGKENWLEVHYYKLMHYKPTEISNHKFILELDQNKAKIFPMAPSNQEKTHGWLDSSLRSVKVDVAKTVMNWKYSGA